MSRSTNNDLISRSVLLSALCTDCANGKISIEGCCESGCEVVKLIRSMPTIDAEPVRHGKWEMRRWEDMKAESGEHTIATARCSLCGLWCEQVRDWTGRVEYDYCPHCGARMDGEEDADRPDRCGRS